MHIDDPNMRSFVITPDELETLVATLLERMLPRPRMRELWRCKCGRIALDRSYSPFGEVTFYEPIPVQEKHGPLCECDPCIHGGPTRPDNHFTLAPDIAP